MACCGLARASRPGARADPGSAGFPLRLGTGPGLQKGFSRSPFRRPRAVNGTVNRPPTGCLPCLFCGRCGACLRRESGVLLKSHECGACVTILPHSNCAREAQERAQATHPPGRGGRCRPRQCSTATRHLCASGTHDGPCAGEVARTGCRSRHPPHGSPPRRRTRAHSSCRQPPNVSCKSVRGFPAGERRWRTVDCSRPTTKVNDEGGQSERRREGA